MAEILRTDLTTATDRSVHPGQHNEVNRRFLALESAVSAAGVVAKPANGLPAQTADYDAHGYKMRNVGAPVTAGDAATRGYVDTAITGVAPKPINSLPPQTGLYDARGQRITNLGAPTTGSDAVTRAYVDGAAKPVNGLPAQTGPYDARAYRFTNLAAPGADTDAATKKYVDDTVSGLPAPVIPPANALPAQTGDYNAQGFKVTGLAGPMTDTDAATKKYADDAAASAVSGVVMPAAQPIDALPAQTGTYDTRGYQITGLPAPSGDSDAATKRYTDDLVAGVVVPVIPPANALPAQTADYSAQGFRLTNVARPVASSDAATKKYTDDMLSAFSGGTAVPINSLPAQTADYDAQGRGITNLRPPVSATDAATKKYTDDAVAAGGGGGGGGPAVPINSLPAQTADYNAQGFTITALATPTGNTDAATKKYTDDAVADVTLIAGAGLTETAGTLDAVGTANRITVGPDTIDIAATYAGQASITTLGPVGTGQWQATPVGVAYGGTGATDAATARANLGITAASGDDFTTAYLWGTDF